MLMFQLKFVIFTVQRRLGALRFPFKRLNLFLHNQITVAASPLELAKASDFIVSMLSTPEASIDVVRPFTLTFYISYVFH